MALMFKTKLNFLITFIINEIKNDLLIQKSYYLFLTD
jgi:hypothetical protein